MGELVYNVIDLLLIFGVGFWFVINPKSVLKKKKFANEQTEKKWLLGLRIIGGFLILSKLATLFLK